MFHRSFITCLFLFGFGTLWAQKYNFVNYTVDDGLVQSQANNTCRDKLGHLWVSTMGGVSCYDGKAFKNFTTNNGLLSNIAYSITCDAQNNILICTDKGLSIFNGRDFHNKTFNYNGKDHRVISVVPTGDSAYFVLAGSRLFTLQNDSVKSYLINEDTSLHFTALGMNGGLLFAAAYKKGLYVFEDGKWNMTEYPASKHAFFFIKKVNAARNKKTYILSFDGIYEYADKKLTLSDLPMEVHEMNDISCIASDDKIDLWMGTFKGALVVDMRKEIHYYNSAGGCTDNRIADIVYDDEGNLWLSSDGQGIFRYSVCPFTYYNETNGLPHPVVMSIVKAKDGRIYSGTYGGGLVRFSKDKTETFTLPSKAVGAQQILTCTLDPEGTVWVGTQNSKIWKFDGQRFIAMDQYKGIPPGSIGELFFDNRGRMWVGTPFGFGFVRDGKFKLVRANEFTWAIMQSGDDSILLTTKNQLLLYTKDSCMDATHNEHLRRSDVTGAVRGKDGNYWLMTNGYGLLIWDMARDSVLKAITTQNGLNSDFIYNIKIDRDNNYWIGTGAGINKIVYDHASGNYAIYRYGKTEGMFGQESNKSAVMQNDDGKIWFGTTKGLYIYNAADEQAIKYPSRIILQNVKLYSQAIPGGQYNDSLSTWYNIPLNLRLPHTENHLTFTFAAINFNNPDKVMYQYKIEGLEKVWSEPSAENTVIYPSLPPGRYIFKVRLAGAATPELEYPFEIKAPFYSTIWFRIIIVASLILIGVGIQAIRNYNKKMKEREIQRLREEEQNKVRQRTAEDFHDEVGNKLTRISLLADILKSKTENEHIISLSDKIKDNTNELYTGTKDIIWALNPENDNLTEMLLYLEAFGNNLVQDSDVNFRSSIPTQETNGIVLPMGYNRNITMIFKEGINNALKHGHCRNIELQSRIINESVLEVTLKDDGKGIDTSATKRGSGLQNMLQRTLRINGTLKVTNNNPEPGTSIVLTLNIPK